MGMYGIFPFSVILGTVLGCNWSVRADGYFELGLLKAGLHQLGGHCRSFCLAQISMA